MKKALIAMSGGVDSSVAAYLVQNIGYECFGITMHFCGDECVDAKDAKNIADNLKMPFWLLDCREAFKTKVINDFVSTYEAGGTPSPCVVCNRHLKFAELVSFADAKGIDKIVTGHYAQVIYDNKSGRYILKKALDPKKDQSYMLYLLTQEQLSHLILPLGTLTKEEVRNIAEEQGFINAGKRDSQDICFINDGDYVKFICEYTGKDYPSGDFIADDGSVLGRHKGIINYTIGQRKGLGIASSAPLYVWKLDTENNTVHLTHGDNLWSRELYCRNINLIAYDKLTEPIRASVKIRYHHKEQPATVTQIDDDKLKIIFDEPQRAITPGQAAVIYDGDTVIGGGTIV